MIINAILKKNYKNIDFQGYLRNTVELNQINYEVLYPQIKIQ